MIDLLIAIVIYVAIGLFVAWFMRCDFKQDALLTGICIMLWPTIMCLVIVRTFERAFREWLDKEAD